MILPTVWNGLNASTRRQMEMNANAMGNRILWLRLFDRGRGEVVLDIVKVSGRTVTSGTGLLTFHPDVRLHLMGISRWTLVSLGIPIDSENFVIPEGSHLTLRRLVPTDASNTPLSLRQREQLAAETVVSDEIKKLITIDITGFANESRDSQASDDNVTL